MRSDEIVTVVALRDAYRGGILRNRVVVDDEPPGTVIRILTAGEKYYFFRLRGERQANIIRCGKGERPLVHGFGRHFICVPVIENGKPVHYGPNGVTTTVKEIVSFPDEVANQVISEAKQAVAA